MSTSNSTTEKTTKTVTNTTQEIGAIGLTGEDYVDVVEAQTELQSKVLQQSGQNFTQLLGGASSMIGNQLASLQQLQEGMTGAPAPGISESSGSEQASPTAGLSMLVPLIALGVASVALMN